METDCEADDFFILKFFPLINMCFLIEISYNAYLQYTVTHIRIVEYVWAHITHII